MIVQVANAALSSWEECTFANGTVGSRGYMGSLWWIFYYFLFFCSSSEVMNGNGYSASSDVSRSSLFCAAKHDLWQERGVGNLWLHHLPCCTFPYRPRRVWGYWIDTATAHIWFGDIARPPFQANNRFKEISGNGKMEIWCGKRGNSFHDKYYYSLLF